MIHFQINSQSGVPAYRQLMEQVKHYMASGILTSGAKLPSIRELARALGVNPATVVRAYSELEHEQVIEMQHGRGVFIAQAGRRLSEAQRKLLLRPLAQQLAVEARQVGAKPEMVLQLLGEEMQKLDGGGSFGEAPQQESEVGNDDSSSR